MGTVKIVVIIGIILAIIVGGLFLLKQRQLPDNFGVLEMRITDAPPNVTIKNLYLTISKIQVHSENLSWIEFKNEPLQFDLVALIDSPIDALIGSNYLEPGKYTQIRLNIDSAVMVLDNGIGYNITIPSSELKLISPFEIVAGKKLVMTLDFDAKNSIVSSSGGYSLKPTVKVIYDNVECLKDSDCEGYVADFLCGDRTFCSGNECATESVPCMTPCNESWVCSNWGACNGTQSRTCTDANNCGTSANKPSLIQVCYSCPGQCCAGQRKCYDSKKYQVCLASGSWSGILSCNNNCTGEGVCS